MWPIQGSVNKRKIFMLYNTNYDLSMGWSDACAQISVESGTPQTYTVVGASTTIFSVRFTYTSISNVWVTLNSNSSAIPSSGSVGVLQHAEYRPGCDGTQRYVKGGDVLYFQTTDMNAYIGLRLMQIV